MSEAIINTRAKQILNTLIARYIKDGQPVGSKAIVSDCALQVSSATVRNLMAELEGEGYLSSPHTSAGRVPTVKGYRFFVDHLLRFHPGPKTDMTCSRSQLNEGGTSKEIVESASSILSSLSS